MRDPAAVLLSRFAVEVTLAAVTAAIGAVVTIGALEFGTGWGDGGPQPGYFPFYIGIIVMLASGGVLVEAFANRERLRATAFLRREQGMRIAAFFGPMVGFVLVASLLGLYVALIVYLTATMVVQGHYRLPRALAVSVGSAVIFYLIFEVWFRVPLLKGPLEALLRIH
jgi:hypothetical protein